MPGAEARLVAPVGHEPELRPSRGRREHVQSDESGRVFDAMRTRAERLRDLALHPVAHAEAADRNIGRCHCVKNLPQGSGTYPLRVKHCRGAQRLTIIGRRRRQYDSVHMSLGIMRLAVAKRHRAPRGPRFGLEGCVTNLEEERMNRRYLSLVALLLVFTALPLSASQFMEMPFDRVAREANLIVRGTVVDTWSAWDDTHELIFTYANVRVNRYFGESTGPDMLVVREVGGTVDGYTQEAIGFPMIRQGENVVLMLSKWENSTDF